MIESLWQGTLGTKAGISTYLRILVTVGKKGETQVSPLVTTTPGKG